MEQKEGLDQGCPLSPPLFCITIRSALEELLRIGKLEDEDFQVLAFLDDTYFQCRPSLVPMLVEAARRLMGALGLSMNDKKMKVWGPGLTPDALPEEVRGAFAPSLSVLGSAAAYAHPERFADDPSNIHKRSLKT